MSAVAVRRLPLAGDVPARTAQPRLFALPGGGAGRRLDAALSALVGDIAAGRDSVCPVCRGTVRPRPTAAAGALAGRCGDCGTTVD